ncbi:hypothetical protein F53441_5392 [Fusarium austroafricanum]|uniref:Uncharacterized protein n=1 Tax=Fusarium austroafricanum TaxID=2364996 RepID=A0A8H4NZR3_9HYPO|nr:hypothetical protein F53441_5392 [Fusarium austroafricanum]
MGSFEAMEGLQSNIDAVLAENATQKSQIAAQNRQIAELRHDRAFSQYSDAASRIQGREQSVTDESEKVDGSVSQPRPSKLSLVDAPADAPTAWPWFDSRFDEDRWKVEKPTEMTWSQDFLCFAFACLDGFCEEVYPSMLLFSIYILRHSNAAECPIQDHCDHWEVIVVDDAFQKQEGSVDLEVLCINPRLISRRVMDAFGPFPLTTEQETITCQPTKLYNYLKPNFGVLGTEEANVAAFRVLGRDSDTKVEHWMDKYGRPILKYPNEMTAETFHDLFHVMWEDITDC